MPKIKILHLESAMGFGGQQIRILNKIRALREKNYWITLGAFPKSEIFKKACQMELKVYPLPLKKRDLKGIFAVLDLIKKEHIHILHTHTSWDSWLGGIVKTIYPKFALIRTRHVSTPIGRTPLSWLLYNVFPHYIITTGEAIKNQLINYNKFNPKKIVSIPTGVDLAVFDPDKVKPGLLPPNGFNIGMISIFLEWKGHKYFILAAKEILKEIPHAEFYIVGNGNKRARARIEKQIQDFNLQNKVHLLGFREDIPQILASLDVLVHPSYAGEGLPQAILQALAMKKPVITTNIGSIYEVIKHRETGLIVPHQDPQAITEAVLELYKSPALREKLGKKGRKLVEQRYSFAKMIEEIENIYNSCRQ
ncbi:MAG: D-inositol-3-phosphate glycosyltransferase [Candidatus Methanoperedenaceae archaeon GB50]|nr:D-inositol-3-phosphate glycosyltransferase [Candidatus Methanoperedenaceae archaeon GB50]CAD7769579.1 D-inositol-3-phosphate glycosyltransferase [Candidatus Methanoperedenaceae archaeon GB37]CAD7779767.1 MAG: D-inositol-3-phosphate glycosyltransferase [Candidatus Methanoperedenaceae archaeon GB50]